jgi:hypothetical protein
VASKVFHRAPLSISVESSSCDALAFVLCCSGELPYLAGVAEQEAKFIMAMIKVIIDKKFFILLPHDVASMSYIAMYFSNNQLKRGSISHPFLIFSQRLRQPIG